VARAHRRLTLVGARKAAGHTQESLAAALHVDRSTVIRWEAGEQAPLPYLRPMLARLLGQSPEQLRELIDHDVEKRSKELDGGNADMTVAFDWLDRHAGWSPGTSRRKVTDRPDTLDERTLRDRNGWRGKAGRSAVAQALSDYYGDAQSPDVGTYRACFGNLDVATSIATQPGWLNLACPLTPGHDRLIMTTSASNRFVQVDELAAEHAVRRLAETIALGVRVANAPIYRLLAHDIAREAIDGRVGLGRFVEYALTMDLLEGELLDTIASGTALRPGSLPLRDKYLSDFDAVLDVSSRLCAGGVLALCAIARPADVYRGAADYALLIQERSEHVLNAARQLAVIPKGFHQPLADYRSDAQVGATLRREMEEGLFGRSDIDTTVSPQVAAAPMHPSRLSEPMRWLTGVPDALRMECTGFGLNLVSGNYEFACLIVIDDEEFWQQYSGRIEANWESVGLRLYSTLDPELLAGLIADDCWSNEGLFALLLGLRRLGEVGGKRVNLPAVQ
jgi:DNA-binding XRE family transcriptional regulator